MTFKMWGWNSGPHVHTASILLTDPPPHLNSLKGAIVKNWSLALLLFFYHFL